ncbi:DUF123 domain-containing protein [Acidianus sulfidivorans JP7]|uniref:DUF123 domain-containing protein n=1 Tax=Acidianus sulfidivorans JP7 TaxID=619593 RepID=A0A2U9IK85_9CREN|nr:DUF123 domain-containing protein [Acidianus sulfidivorans]AWR96386.1 DUF123 domain-containing protein [Acidianus sulfidivorans JP7]
MNNYKGYLVFFYCDKSTIKTKSKEFYLREGYYVYVGSCGKNCAKRISRHLSKQKKKLHWHIDYLSEVCEPLCALVLPITEKELAKRLPYPGIDGFGNTDDKGSRTHLFCAEINDLIKFLIRSKMTYK